MKFEKEFASWLSKALSDEVNPEVSAFSFNLYEVADEAGVKFGIELIGASTFDLNDPDWACDEVWEPKQRQLLIPIAYSGETWTDCLTKLKDLVIRSLAAPQDYAEQLKRVAGIGIGFVDGDLEIIWPA